MRVPTFIPPIPPATPEPSRMIAIDGLHGLAESVLLTGETLDEAAVSLSGLFAAITASKNSGLNITSHISIQVHPHAHAPDDQRVLLIRALGDRLASAHGQRPVHDCYRATHGYDWWYYSIQFVSDFVERGFQTLDMRLVIPISAPHPIPEGGTR